MAELIGPFDRASDYTLQFTVTHTLMPTVTSSLPLLSSGFQRRTFPFLWVPATNFSQQQVTTTEPQQSSN
jgi:hypothetical protein